MWLLTLFAVCTGVSKYEILLVQQKLFFLLCSMKMEEQALIIKKESWSIDMKQWFEDELCKMTVNIAENSTGCL